MMKCARVVFTPTVPVAHRVRFVLRYEQKGGCPSLRDTRGHKSVNLQRA